MGSTYIIVDAALFSKEPPKSDAKWRDLSTEGLAFFFNRSTFSSQFPIPQKVNKFQKKIRKDFDNALLDIVVKFAEGTGLWLEYPLFFLKKRAEVAFTNDSHQKLLVEVSEMSTVTEKQKEILGTMFLRLSNSVVKDSIVSYKKFEMQGCLFLSLRDDTSHSSLEFYHSKLEKEGRSPMYEGLRKPIQILTPIARALEFLHGIGFSHGCVNVDNIVFAVEKEEVDLMKWKLKGFGMKDVLGDFSELNAYVPPEYKGMKTFPQNQDLRAVDVSLGFEELGSDCGWLWSRFGNSGWFWPTWSSCLKMTKTHIMKL